MAGVVRAIRIARDEEVFARKKGLVESMSLSDTRDASSAPGG